MQTDEKMRQTDGGLRGSGQSPRMPSIARPAAQNEAGTPSGGPPASFWIGMIFVIDLLLSNDP